jgi:hypothetical protein
LIVVWKYGVRSFLQKSRIILYFPLFLESFVIGFVNELYQLLSKKSSTQGGTLHI